MESICSLPISTGWRLQLRYVVAFLGFLGAMVDYIVRYSISVAIVAMVKVTHPVNNASHASNACQAALNVTDETGDAEYKGSGEYNWTIQQQGIILGTFFWGYFITKSSGGRISELLGARETMAVSLGASGLLSLLCPAAAHVHPLALAGVRLVMGLVQGPANPALYSVLSRWSPPDEMATLVTLAYSGIAGGSLVALGASGWVVNLLGWRWIFWGGGILALAWTPLWLFFVRNSPEQHPLISRAELELLAGTLHIKPRRSVPWRRLLRCWRFYPSVVAEMASSWVSNLTTTEGAIFLKTQIGLDLRQVGWVLSAGQGSSCAATFAFGRVSDVLVRRRVLTKLNTRRLMHSLGALLIVGGLLCIVWAGCQAEIVAVMMVLVMVGSASTLCTFQLAPMDLAPNYAGTLSGLLGLGNLSGFVAPLVTAQLVTKTGSWLSSFLLGGGIYLVASVLYVATVTTQVQEWNYYEEILS
ncbi:vesicular glutamate transporter 1-like [Penaeus chinensis]|uniref:vesicular glutamate transporter 1-like n=1 Tax=Penaeus chinensis TaxID=139456 RepID=UPI001FB602D7|nr:vesicular glutamate transporter 1-like [Penaeus chinensis]